MVNDKPQAWKIGYNTSVSGENVFRSEEVLRNDGIISTPSSHFIVLFVDLLQHSAAISHRSAPHHWLRLMLSVGNTHQLNRKEKATNKAKQDTVSYGSPPNYTTDTQHLATVMCAPTPPLQLPLSL